MSELEVHCEQALKAFVSAVLTVEELATLAAAPDEHQRTHFIVLVSHI